MRASRFDISFAGLLSLFAMGSCLTAEAKQPALTPAQILTKGDWEVEDLKTGKKFVMRFESERRRFKTANTQPELPLADPIGKWWSQDDKIRTERFLNNWRNEITVRGKDTFSMTNKEGRHFTGRRLPPLPPPPPPKPPAVPAPENK